MAYSNFMRVEDVAEELSVSKSHAYKIMRMLNAELEQKGLITVTGRVSTRYFMERLCYGTANNETVGRSE